MGKDEYVCSYYILYIHITEKKEALQVKRPQAPARAPCPGLHITLLLERRKKACHRQSCNTGSGRKAHPVRGIVLISVKTV